MLQLTLLVEKLRAKLKARVENDPAGYKRAVAVFEKAVDILPASSDTAICRAMYGFGKTEFQVMNDKS